jgi:hypothetical protein
MGTYRFNFPYPVGRVNDFLAYLEHMDPPESKL